LRERFGIVSFVDRNRDQAQRREHDAMLARAKSQRIIEGVAARLSGTGAKEIEVLLALGEACPFHTWPDKVIWLEEVHARLYGGD
jgi:hypothetical protein